MIEATDFVPPQPCGAPTPYDDSEDAPKCMRERGHAGSHIAGNDWAVWDDEADPTQQCFDCDHHYGKDGHCNHRGQGIKQSKDSPWYSATPSLREFLNLTLVDVAQWIWDHPGETFEAAKWREQIVNYVERQTQQKYGGPLKWSEHKCDDGSTYYEAEAADLEATMPDNAVTRALADWFENYGYCDDSCDWSVCWPQMRRHIEDRIFPRDSEAQK